MRDRLAPRWIGLHAAALAGRGLVIAPAWALWGASAGSGWIWVHALLTWLPVAYLQTRAPGPGAFPVPFRWWGPAVMAGFVLAYGAAESTFHAFLSLALGQWIDSLGISPSAAGFVASVLTYGFVFPLPQAAVLIWKCRDGSIWLWVAAVAGVQMVMAPLGFIDSCVLESWKAHPLESYGILLLLGVLHGAVLGLATLIPLRRLLAEAKSPAA